MSPEGDLEVVSPSVATNQTAACWVVVTKDGRFAYDTNAGSGSISGFHISYDGTITLLDDDGRTGVTGDGSGSLDMAFSSNGRYLYSLNGGNNTISAFRVANNGRLFPIDIDAAVVPAGANGLAARQVQFSYIITDHCLANKIEQREPDEPIDHFERLIFDRMQSMVKFY